MINSITQSHSEPVQNGSTVVTTGDTTMINCLISDPEYSVEWIYRSPLDVETDVTESSTFSIRTGVSALNISSQQPGFYSCVINTDMVLSFYITDRDTLGKRKLSFIFVSPSGSVAPPRITLSQRPLRDLCSFLFGTAHLKGTI